MNYRIETDGLGREVIAGEVGGRPVFLVLEHVMRDRSHGHSWLTNDARTSLERLAPWQADMLKWLEKERPPAEPVIFAGDSPNG